MRACTDNSDPGRVEVRERVEQRIRPEIEHMVVCEGDAVDTEPGQRLRRPGRGAEVEHSPGGRLPSRRDAAFEVEHEEIGFADDLHQLRREERVARVVHESLADAASEHRVACQRELHGAKPCSP